MADINNIPSFVLSGLSGQADSEEQKQLENWLKDPENKRTYKQLQAISEISADLKLYKSFNKSEALTNVKASIRVNKGRRILAYLQRAAAIMFIPLLIGSIFMAIQYFGSNGASVHASVVQQLSSPPGTRSHFYLPDSSEVWLNASSSIRFSSTFEGDTRLVELQGEGYFKVYKNKVKPFIVHSKDMAVKAIGTAFNVCGYADESDAFVTLEEGKIEVRNNKSKQALIALPGEQVQFSEADGALSKAMVNVDDFTAWKEGRLVFNKVPLSQVVNTLGRWYNVDIEFVNAGVGNYRYTATFTNESIYQVMELLKLTAPINFSFADRNKIGEGNEFTKQKIKIWKTVKNSQPM